MGSGQRTGQPASRPDHLPVGAILRRFRKEAALDVETLSAQANVSESLLRKVESGHRPATKQTIEAVAPVLGIPSAHAQQLLLLSGPQRRSGPEISERRPSLRELTLLDSSPFPACYMRSPTWAHLVDGALHEVVATNAAFDRFFHGLGPGVSVLDYELLQQQARDIFIRWDEDAHQLVQACRSVLTTFVADAGIEAVRTRLRSNPDFDGMWETPFPAFESRDTVWLRNPSDEAEFEMYFHLSRDSSPWLRYALTPVDLPRYLRLYPPQPLQPGRHNR